MVIGEIGIFCWFTIPIYFLYISYIPSGNLLQSYGSHGHGNSEFSHWKWWFSIAMLNYQALIYFLYISQHIGSIPIVLEVYILEVYILSFLYVREANNHIMISPYFCWLNIHENHRQSNGFIDDDDDDDDDFPMIFESQQGWFRQDFLYIPAPPKWWRLAAGLRLRQGLNPTWINVNQRWDGQEKGWFMLIMRIISVL